MYNATITNNEITLKTIDNESIEKLYSIYANTEEFKYATGVFSNPPDFNQYIRELYMFLLKENTFIFEIQSSNIQEPIGIIKGSITDNEKIIWINSFAIDTPFQAKGYGRKVINMLEKYFCYQKHYIKGIYLSVSKNNISGMNFWNKCGYRACDALPEKYLNKLNEQVQIMVKIL